MLDTQRGHHFMCGVRRILYTRLRDRTCRCLVQLSLRDEKHRGATTCADGYGAGHPYGTYSVRVQRVRVVANFTWNMGMDMGMGKGGGAAARPSVRKYLEADL